MDIFLIRHTKTDTLAGLCYGQTDVPLAATFAEEVRALHLKLPVVTEHCLVFSSPLRRCRDLAQTFQKPIQVDNRLLELNFGDWENRLFDEIDAALLKKWTENFVTHAPPNGETFNGLCFRAGQFWEDLLSKTQAEQVLLITHAGVIRALLTHILQLPPANAFKFRVDVGSIHKLQHLDNYTYLHYINR